MHLTPQDRRRIYEEERARIAAEEQVRARMMAVAASKQPKTMREVHAEDGNEVQAHAEVKAGGAASVEAAADPDSANPDQVYWMGEDDEGEASPARKLIALRIGAIKSWRGIAPLAKAIQSRRGIAFIVAAALALATYGIYTTGEKKIHAALSAFHRQLAVEDFAAAVKDLHAAQSVFKYHPDVRQAQDELRHAIAQVKRYQQGLAFLRANEPAKAIAVLEPIRGYRDVGALLVEASYRAAKEAIAARRWEEAKDYLAGLDPNLHDVSALWSQVNNALAARHYDRRLPHNEGAAGEGDERLLGRARALRAMAQFDGTPLAVAVRSVHISSAVSTSADSFIAAYGYQFVWLELAVRNTGSRTVHSDPNDFVILSPAGEPINPHAETTHLLSHPLAAADLPPGGRAAGYLIFHVPKRDAYSLQMDASTEHVRKRIVATEWRY
jgi:uncharacterized protein DUF4352